MILSEGKMDTVFYKTELPVIQVSKIETTEDLVEIFNKLSGDEPTLYYPRLQDSGITRFEIGNEGRCIRTYNNYGFHERDTYMGEILCVGDFIVWNQTGEVATVQGGFFNPQLIPASILALVPVQPRLLEQESNSLMNPVPDWIQVKN
jgi:hypothetical protein